MQNGPRLGYNGPVIYLVYSEEAELARRSALKIIKKEFPERDEVNYLSLNMAVSTVQDIVEECSYLPLGAERKAVFAEDCAFLLEAPRGKAAGKAPAKGKKGKSVDSALDALAEYCGNPNPNISLYLACYGANLDEKNPVVKAIGQTGKILHAPVPPRSGWIDFAQRFLKKYGSSMSDETAEELVNRVDGDYGRFLGELAKLATYANGEPLSLQAVKILVSPKLEDNAFAMSNLLLQNDIEGAFRAYRDLKVHNVDEVRLLNMLANQIRFMDLVAFLREQGMDERSMARELNAKPGRILVTLRNLYRVRPEALSRALERIYRAEKAILTGEETPRFAFERFLANFTL